MNYVEVYKSVLDFHRKYRKAEDTKQYWENVKGESEQIFNEYGKHRFVKELLLAVINELERKGKELKANE